MGINKALYKNHKLTLSFKKFSWNNIVDRYKLWIPWSLWFAQPVTLECTIPRTYSRLILQIKAKNIASLLCIWNGCSMRFFSKINKSILYSLGYVWLCLFNAEIGITSNISDIVYYSPLLPSLHHNIKRSSLSFTCTSLLYISTQHKYTVGRNNKLEKAHDWETLVWSAFWFK